jgi:hypothetical protein
MVGPVTSIFYIFFCQLITDSVILSIRARSASFHNCPLSVVGLDLEPIALFFPLRDCPGFILGITVSDVNSEVSVTGSQASTVAVDKGLAGLDTDSLATDMPCTNSISTPIVAMIDPTLKQNLAGQIC